MNWVTLIVLSSLVSSGCNILDKRLMDKQMAPPLAAAASFGVAGLPVALVGLIFLPPVSRTEAFRGLSAGVLFVAAAWLYYDTMAREEVSRLVPLLRLSTVQTLVLGWIFLGEALSRRELMAFTAMVIGSVLLTLKPGARGWTFSRGALRMVPVTTLLAANQVLLAPVYRNAGLWVGVVWENLGMVLGSGLLVWMMVRRFAPSFTLDFEWQDLVPKSETGLFGRLGVSPRYSRRRQNSKWGDRHTWGLLVLEQATRLITGLAPAWAIAHGVPVALLSAIAGIRLAWVWLLAVFLLGERVERRDLLLKGGGMLGMSFGMYWLL